jgi:hypothetical protein
LISSEFRQLYYQDEEENKEIFMRFDKIMGKFNIKEMKFDYICRQYLFLLQELNQEVVTNELFLFSILTGRINAAKVLWKRGKVRSFKIYLLFLYLIFI